jgi:hypothetical protein
VIYLVEAYGSGPAQSQDDIGRAVEAVDPVTIRYLATIPVPKDEVTFRLFRSTTREALIASLEAAAVPFARVSEVGLEGLPEHWATGEPGPAEATGTLERDGHGIYVEGS